MSTWQNTQDGVRVKVEPRDLTASSGPYRGETMALYMARLYLPSVTSTGWERHVGTGWGESERMAVVDAFRAWEESKMIAVRRPARPGVEPDNAVPFPGEPG